jgi:hypothetical protein
MSYVAVCWSNSYTKVAKPGNKRNYSDEYKKLQNKIPNEPSLHLKITYRNSNIQKTPQRILLRVEKTS